MNDGVEVLMEALMRHIETQKANGNTPDSLLMSTETLKKIAKGLGEPNKLDILGIPITINDAIPYCRIGLAVEVAEGNLEKTLEGLKDGL